MNSHRLFYSMRASDPAWTLPQAELGKTHPRALKRHVFPAYYAKRSLGPLARNTLILYTWYMRLFMISVTWVFMTLWGAFALVTMVQTFFSQLPH